MFPLPFGDLRRHPEAVNADRDHDEQEPLDPQAKKAYPGASEHQLSALNERVLRPPLLHEDKLASRLPTDSLHLQDPNNPACLTSFRHAVSSSTRHCARRRITRRTSSGHRKWAGQPLTSCHDPFSERVPGNCPNFPSVGDSENTKALIRRVGFWSGQKPFQGETPKIPARRLHPNEYGAFTSIRSTAEPPRNRPVFGG